MHFFFLQFLSSVSEKRAKDSCRGRHNDMPWQRNEGVQLGRALKLLVEAARQISGVWKDDTLFLTEWCSNYFLSLHGRSFCVLVCFFSSLICHSINWVKALSKLHLIGLVQFCLIFHRRKYACVHVQSLWGIQDQCPGL